MKHKRNWVIGIILSATAAFVALQNVAAPTHEVETPQAVITLTASPEPSPTVAEGYGGCGYMWAYHDDPELTRKVDEAIRQLNPAASARAQQFGEDCVYADGHSTFGAMETDFYVQLPIEDLTDNDLFGNWIAQVMTMVTEIPREEIQGGKYGFVEFSFEKSDTERLIVRVPIEKYLENGQGKTGTELLQLFIETP
ncbi:MAG: hypothetical protein JNM02_11900 [Anaerolineales bacterium]|nr:hypothetical protein [Anaerolineales bacterium]